MTYAIHTHAGTTKGTPTSQQSRNLYGSLGLNTTPSARHDPAGFITATISTSDPYVHGSISAQLSDNFNITLRQSAEVSNITDDPDRFYPGIDLRLKLLNEDTYAPAMTLGLNSAFGHKRFASEYLVASKRYKDLDFSAGIAWGRLGSAAHISNPLSILGSHFDKRRDLSSENPNTMKNWFTGEDIGFFGGVEYFLPAFKNIDGVSLKADWGADRYIIEQQNIDGFDAPDP